MATNYPGAVDTPTDPTGSNTMDGVTGGAGVIHATQHSNANDGLVAVQNAVGFTGTFKFQGKLTPTAVKTANYTAAPGDFIPCDTNAVGAFTITLPTAPTNGAMIGMKYVTVGTGLLVTYQCGGSDVLNVAGGATSGVLTIKSQSETLQYNSATHIWYLLAGDAPLGQLDLRYQNIAAAAGGDLTGTYPNPTLTGSSNVESIIRANTLNQLAAPTASLSMNSQRNSLMHAGIVSTDSANLAQLAGSQRAYVISGCVWTADAPASTLNGSMPAGTVSIAGIQLTVAAVTAHAFTASRDTYVDLTDNGDGTAAITYTAVVNNTISPALTGGTLLNTIRVGVIVSGASNITSTAASIFQGGGGVNTPTAQGSSTVAAGSNGSNITATPLNVAAGANFAAGGGWVQVAHAAGQTYTISYASVSSNTLTGVAVISGSGTVSTGDTVTQVTPFTTCDMLGNLIYPTRPHPTLIGYAQLANAYTTTLTAATPVAGLIAPFVIPAGAPRLVRVTMVTPYLSASAAAGNTYTLNTYVGNSVSGGTAAGAYQAKVSVASDGAGATVTGYSPTPLAPGSYTAQIATSQGAAGTLTMSLTYNLSFITVELV